MARNDVTHALKEVAEKKLGKPVRCVLQRGGSSQKRMFLVVFEDGEKTMAHLPKAPSARDKALTLRVKSEFVGHCLTCGDVVSKVSPSARDEAGFRRKHVGHHYVTRLTVAKEMIPAQLTRTVNSDSPDSKAEGEGAK